MKKIIVSFFVFIFFSWVAPAFAEVAINDFTVDVKINQDAAINITENISYDFGTDQKHGIYRDIYYRYKLAKGNFKLQLSDISVMDQDDNPYIFSISDQGDFKRIKIGDPDTTISGVKIYKIKYTVNRAMNYFSDYDELYWNATGNDWQIPIKQIKTVVQLPADVNESELKSECYAGPAASAKACLSERYSYSGKDKVNTITYINDILKTGEGLTFVIGLPKSVVKQPSMIENIFATIKDNGITFLPILVFILMYYLWYKKGRDPRGRGVIIAQYEAPDNLSPAEIGTLIDEHANNKDISAVIIDLAVRGYLKINRLEEKGIFKTADYEMIKLKNSDTLTNSFEKDLLEALFKNDKKTVKLSDLKEKFYKDLEKIKKDIYQSVVDKGYFSSNPRMVKNIYLIMGIVIAVSGWFLGSVFGWLGIMSFVISGFIIIIFSFIMPAKTIKGALAKENILGLKKYLTVAEKDRINFHNAPEKKPEHFEKLLPFAMVLGVEKQWAGQFNDIYVHQPSWYNDNSGIPFNAIYFATSLNSFSAHTNSVMASVPSSAAGGGSGFSGGGVGGGFGGGGGGSW